ncbi:hypothetical protein MMC19_005975 [Ptychographa xylographoides]|nr:hypothetical protein [Ptychographa xylographoides]
MIRNGCPSVWLGQSNDQQQVIIKEARDNQSFDAEVNALDGYLRGHGSFRQLVNVISDRKIMVFEHLADNLHNVLYTRPQRKLEEGEVKRVTKVVLEGLATMHEKNIAHTDIKSYNIVVDLDQSGSFSRIKLIDLGDSVEIQPTTHHHFTHPTYRAPEGLLGMPWTTKVDLWALGTLCAYFGPFSKSFVELSDGITMGDLDGIEMLVAARGGRQKYRNTLTAYISDEAVSFLDKFMKLDPRDRPSPQELLQEEWLSSVVSGGQGLL